MNIEPHQIPLMIYLQSANPTYYGKAIELRNEIKGWLSYVTETFQHYTSHTVDHSDEIILQISKLLFKNDDPRQPVIKLSTAEAYILTAAAYLHDSGMVTSNMEKLEIIASNSEWKNWITGEGGGAKRWHEIESLRQQAANEDSAAKHFNADLQTRFLIAEFIRRSHHLRAADVIMQYENHLGRFAFGNPMLQRTIADVCIAHGLRTHELEDRERYPEKRDIQGYAVNVRLIAILLRLGDLLDMSYDRACPLLLNAANPLPADSYAHWTQYQRIIHRSTSPNKIEIIAECRKQEEHRVLQDWCQWIADEVSQAEILMSRVDLHHEWQPPVATMGSPDATIIIRPAADANYFPSKWSFELDHEAVFGLLIKDVYDKPLTFIRELIQNALDANRSQMYADLVKENIGTPEYPTQVEESFRQRYPVRISLETKKVLNESSKEIEDRQVVIIDDSGIGMDKEIIQRYFLQVGRSYYTTSEFRRNFRFVPTSRFGIGFLSVFAASDNVSVETYKPSSAHRDASIRLTLTGPRNYLLTEVGARRTSGTRIEVLLRESIAQGKFTRLIFDWCRRVEFPLIVNDLGMQKTIVAERAEQFTKEVLDFTEEGAKFVIRAFPFNRSGIEGDLYVLARVDNKGEDWSFLAYYMAEILKKHPQSSLLELPENSVCLHGIEAEDIYFFTGDAKIARLDLRGDRFNPTLSRQSIALVSETDFISRWEEILYDHLSSSYYATSEDGWIYKQKLVDRYKLPFWHSLSGMIPITANGKRQLLSLKDFQEIQVITLVLPIEQKKKQNVTKKNSRKKINFVPKNFKGTILLGQEADLLSREYSEQIFVNRSVTNAVLLTKDYLALDWTINSEENTPFIVASDIGRITSDISCFLIPLPNETVALGFFFRARNAALLLNTNHPFIQWLKVILLTCEKEEDNLRNEQVQRLMALIYDASRNKRQGVQELNEFLSRWIDLLNLPQELYPPITKLTPEMFELKYKDQ